MQEAAAVPLHAVRGTQQEIIQDQAAITQPGFWRYSKHDESLRAP